MHIPSIRSTASRTASIATASPGRGRLAKRIEHETGHRVRCILRQARANSLVEVVEGHRSCGPKKFGAIITHLPAPTRE